MITKEILEKNHQYLLKNTKSLNLGSEPKPMFINGTFSSDNWNGGDCIIRQFLNWIENLSDNTNVFKLENQVMVTNYIYDEDTKYVYITFIDSNYKTVDITNYCFEWYKNRGRTDSVLCDNEIISEEQYISLLNDIEELTNFKFDFVCE